MSPYFSRLRVDGYGDPCGVIFGRMAENFNAAIGRKGRRGFHENEERRV